MINTVIGFSIDKLIKRSVMPFYKIPEDAAIEFVETKQAYYLVINGQTYDSSRSVSILTHLGDVYLQTIRPVLDYLTSNTSDDDDSYRIHSLDFKKTSHNLATSIEVALTLPLVEPYSPNGMMVRFLREKSLLELPPTNKRECHYLLIDDDGNRWLEC